MCRWTNDAQNFLLDHFDTIHDFPSQIYYFSLPISPSSSWLQKCYSAELSNTVKVVTGTPLGHGKCSRTVSLGYNPLFMSCWNNTIAICQESEDIIILDAVTGNQTAFYSGHTDSVRCSTFSSDGILFVSGSDDKTVKLWDVQTGGVIKTFSGHTNDVTSVSISLNTAMIASGDCGGGIYLWDVQTGEPSCIIKQEKSVAHVIFSPINFQHLISVSNGKVWQWDIDGHQVGPTYDGSHIAFSSDGTQFVLCNGATITVQHSDTRVTVTQFLVAGGITKSCCFSPDGRLIAVTTGNSIYVQDINSLDPHPIKPFTRQANLVEDLIFSSPSTLISATYDKSVRFWQIGTPPPPLDPVTSDQKSTPITSTPILSISLNPRSGIVISSDKDGVVKTWDILTGFCRGSFQTPAGDTLRDVQLIDEKLVSVWHRCGKIHIWDTEKAEPLQTVEVRMCRSLRISGDGSKIFCLIDLSTIKAWSIWTGEPIGKIEFESFSLGNSFYLDGSKIWIEFTSSLVQGWDFGFSGSSPVLLSNASIERSCLQFIRNPHRIISTITGKVVFQLAGRYAEPKVAQWDGQYLVAGYETGEVMIFGFSHLYPQQESVLYCLCSYW